MSRYVQSYISASPQHTTRQQKVLHDLPTVFPQFAATAVTKCYRKSWTDVSFSFHHFNNPSEKPGQYWLGKAAAPKRTALTSQKRSLWSFSIQLAWRIGEHPLTLLGQAGKPPLLFFNFQLSMNLLHEKPVSHRSNLPSIPICEREQSDRDRKGQKRETKVRQTGRQEEAQRETERKRR